MHSNDSCMYGAISCTITCTAGRNFVYDLCIEKVLYEVVKNIWQFKCYFYNINAFVYSPSLDILKPEFKSKFYFSSRIVCRCCYLYLFGCSVLNLDLL